MSAERDTTPTVLVTGATGTVGTPLVRHLIPMSVRVRVATRSPETARERFGQEAASVGFDLEHPETWGPALDDVDRMVLLYPPAVDVGTVRSFANAASRVGVEQVVFLSVLGADKLPILPHRRIETHLAKTDMATTVLHAAYFMQNLSGIHRPEIVDRNEIFIPAGDGTLGFVDARDIGAVAATVVTESGHENQAYDLTGPAALDFETVAQVFSDVLGRRITYADPSRLAFASSMYRRGVSTSLIVFMLLEYSVVRLGRSGRITGQIEQLLDRPPRTMREFVSDYADSFQSRPPAENPSSASR